MAESLIEGRIRVTRPWGQVGRGDKGNLFVLRMSDPGKRWGVAASP
jgi:hypothetical protein